MLSSIDASHGTGLWHELVDSMRMLEAECSSSSTSAACSAKACYSFVCCVYGFCGVESALPERDALAADSQKPFWDSIHQGIALLDKLLCESPDTLAQGWAPGSSLGEQHELGMLLELASLCSIHGNAPLSSDAALCSA